MYAAQLFASAQQQIPQLSAQIRDGDTREVNHWLKENIWQHASLYSTEQLFKKATGEALNPHYFRRHLEQRYLG